MTARLIPLLCNSCGAPLSVPDDVKFLTCSHCQTSLAIEFKGDAYFTRQLDELAERTDAIDAKLSDVANKLERQNLDLKWEIDQKKLMVKDKDGHMVVPQRIDSPSSVFGLILGIVVICFMAVIGSQIAGGLAIVVALFFGALFLVQLAVQHNKAVRYDRAKQRYHRDRDRLTG